MNPSETNAGMAPVAPPPSGETGRPSQEAERSPETARPISFGMEHALRSNLGNENTVGEKVHTDMWTSAQNGSQKEREAVSQGSFGENMLTWLNGTPEHDGHASTMGMTEWVNTVLQTDSPLRRTFYDLFDGGDVSNAERVNQVADMYRSDSGLTGLVARINDTLTPQQQPLEISDLSQEQIFALTLYASYLDTTTLDGLTAKDRFDELTTKLAIQLKDENSPQITQQNVEAVAPLLNVLGEDAGNAVKLMLHVDTNPTSTLPEDETGRELWNEEQRTWEFLNANHPNEDVRNRTDRPEFVARPTPSPSEPPADPTGTLNPEGSERILIGDDDEVEGNGSAESTRLGERINLRPDLVARFAPDRFPGAPTESPEKTGDPDLLKRADYFIDGQITSVPEITQEQAKNLLAGPDQPLWIFSGNGGFVNPKIARFISPLNIHEEGISAQEKERRQNELNRWEGWERGAFENVGAASLAAAVDFGGTTDKSRAAYYVAYNSLVIQAYEGSGNPEEASQAIRNMLTAQINGGTLNNFILHDQLLGHTDAELKEESGRQAIFNDYSSNIGQLWSDKEHLTPNPESPLLIVTALGEQGLVVDLDATQALWQARMPIIREALEGKRELTPAIARWMEGFANGVRQDQILDLLKKEYDNESRVRTGGNGGGPADGSHPDGGSGADDPLSATLGLGNQGSSGEPRPETETGETRGLSGEEIERIDALAERMAGRYYGKIANARMVYFDALARGGDEKEIIDRLVPQIAKSLALGTNEYALIVNQLTRQSLLEGPSLMDDVSAWNSDSLDSSIALDRVIEYPLFQRDSDEIAFYSPLRSASDTSRVKLENARRVAYDELKRQGKIVHASEFIENPYADPLYDPLIDEQPHILELSKIAMAAQKRLNASMDVLRQQFTARIEKLSLEKDAQQAKIEFEKLGVEGDLVARLVDVSHPEENLLLGDVREWIDKIANKAQARATSSEVSEFITMLSKLPRRADQLHMLLRIIRNDSEGNTGGEGTIPA